MLSQNIEQQELEYPEIIKRFEVASMNQQKLVMKSLYLIEHIFDQDQEISSWILSRIKKYRIAAFKLEDALQNPFPRIDLMGHNTGNNRRISFSIISDNIQVLSKPCACVTQQEYWHQGEHNSELHWSRIIATSQHTRNKFLSPSRLLSQEVDSFWLTHMCNLMQEFELARDLLYTYIEQVKINDVLYGDHS